jgi:hypothetical protein
MVTVPVLVLSATEVAVIVIDCGELVAAGAVNVADVVVVFDRVPAEAVQATPAVLRSFVTVAVRVVVSVPSTVVAAAVTVTGPSEAEPPQPESHNTNETERIPAHSRTHDFISIFHSL